MNGDGQHPWIPRSKQLLNGHVDRYLDFYYLFEFIISAYRPNFHKRARSDQIKRDPICIFEVCLKYVFFYSEIRFWRDILNRGTWKHINGMKMKPLDLLALSSACLFTFVQHVSAIGYLNSPRSRDLHLAAALGLDADTVLADPTNFHRTLEKTIARSIPTKHVSVCCSF